MIVYFHAYDISFFKIEFLTSRLRTSCFDFILFIITPKTEMAPSNLQGVVLCGVLSKGDGSLSRSLLIVIGVRARFIANFIVVCTEEYSFEL